MSDGAQSTLRKEPSQIRKDLGYSLYAGQQELRKRFRTSLLGGFWLILGPAFLVLVYWIVFDLVVGVEFGHPITEAKVPFLAAFSIGFFLYLTLGELISGAAGWLQSKRRLLVESSLPLWAVLGILLVRVAIQFMFYTLVVLAVCAWYQLLSVQTAVLYLLVCVPIFILFGGIAVIFAMLGAFFGDVKEMTQVIMRVLFYSSSITFPISMIPEQFQWIPRINPLTWPVELSRDVLLWDLANFAPLLWVLAQQLAVVWGLAILLYWRLGKQVAAVV